MCIALKRDDLLESMEEAVVVNNHWATLAEISLKMRPTRVERVLFRHACAKSGEAETVARMAHGMAESAKMKEVENASMEAAAAPNFHTGVSTRCAE